MYSFISLVLQTAFVVFCIMVILKLNDIRKCLEADGHQTNKSLRELLILVSGNISRQACCSMPLPEDVRCPQCSVRRSHGRR